MANKHASLDALFTDIADAIREKTGDTGTIPAVEFPNLIRDRLELAPPAFLTFSSPSSFTLKVNDTTKHWDGTLEYSTDAYTWSTWDGKTTLSSATKGSDNVLYLRGTGNTVIAGNSQNYRWVLTGSDIACIGNIENLLDYPTVKSGEHPIMADYCYEFMFYGCTSLTQAPALPATTLAEYCYCAMFHDCTSLTQAPSLPATTLTTYCYGFMFCNCTSLTQATTLSATKLASNCYYAMFQGCTSLTQAPALPATTLATYCYRSMFYRCTSLIQVPVLPATTLASYCYEQMFEKCTSLTQAPTLPATTLAAECYYQMFKDCTNLTQAPSLPATTLADYCYKNMFYGCTSLTQAPALPATKLASNCYYAMFYSCTSLTQAPSELPATTLTESCYMFMFEFTAITAIPRIMATTYATDSCKSMFDDIKTLNVYSRSGPGHTYGWTAPASTYCSGMFGSDDNKSEWAKLDGSNFPNSGTPTEGVTYYFATIVDSIVVNITASNISEYFTVTNGSSYYFNGQGNVFTTNNAGVGSSTASTILTAKQDISEISFDYSYSSEPRYDKFTLKVAGSTIENAVSGATTAKSYNGSLASGQTIEFKYVKDSSVNKNDDKCTFSNMVIKLG